MLALLAVLTFGGLSNAQAADRVWDGGGGTGDWDTKRSSRKNWDGDVAYASGQNVVFSSSVQTGVTINTTPLTSGSITFSNNASAFTIGGTATLTINGGVTNNSSQNQTFTVSTIALGAAQTWNAGSASGGSLSVTSSVNNSGFLLTVGGANNTTISGAVSGSGGLAKTGSGRLTLGGANSYSGATTVSGGTVRSTNNGAFGTTAGGVSVAGGAAVELAGGIAVGAEALTLNGTGISGGGALRNISGNNSWAGAITLGSNSRINSDSGTLTVSGGISGAGYALSVGGAGDVTFSTAGLSGPGWLAKDGAGTLNLNVASTHTGGTILNDGAITLGANNALGSGGFTFAGGVLNANNYSDSTIGALSLSANSTLNLGSASTVETLTFSSASYSGGTLTINNWTGTGGTAGSSTGDRIIITASPSQSFLDQVQFTGGNYGQGALWFSATGELVPVPEPIHYALAAFGLIFGGLRAGRFYLVRRRQSR